MLASARSASISRRPSASPIRRQKSISTSAGARRGAHSSLDVGYIYYWYPKELFNTDWAEVYVKVAYAVTPTFTIGGAVFYTPDLLNFSLFTGGNDVGATYYEANAKWVTPWTYSNIGSFVSGAVGINDIERHRDPSRVDPSYVYYNLGVAFTYKALYPRPALSWH